MSDDRWERAREDHIRWQHQDWDREDRKRRADADRAEARRAFAAGDLAWTAHKMGMTDVAISIARGDFASPSAPREDPILETLRRAQRHLDDGEDFRAELELSYQAEQGHPNPRVHFLLGVALFRQKKYAEAAEAFGAAANRGAPAAVCAVFGARCRIRVEEFAAAERWIHEGLAGADCDRKLEAELYGLLGQSRVARDDSAGAATAFEHAVNLDPTDDLTFAWLGTSLVRAERPRDALAAFERARALGVDSATMWYWWGLAHFDVGDFEQAERRLDAAVAKAPDWTAALAMRGNVRGRRGHWADAAADHSRCIELKPGRMRHYIDRGVCHLRLKSLTEALDDFTTAERLGPKSPRPPFYRAECLLGLGRVREAQEAIARSLELGPGHEPALELRERCWKA